MLVLFVMLWQQGQACNVCGCASSSNFINVLPNTNKFLFSADWGLQNFRVSTLDAETDERFFQNYRIQNLSLQARYNLNRHYQLSLNVPYFFNQSRSLFTTPRSFENFNGFGDARIGLSRTWRKENDTLNFSRYLTVNGELILPTGRTNIANANGEIPEGLQPGTGSWAFSGQLIRTQAWERWIWMSDIGGQYNLPNRERYRNGYQLFASTTVMRIFKTGQWQIIPNIGCRGNHTAEDDSNYDYRLKNTNSGGQQLYVLPGLTITHKDWALTSIWAKALAENSAHGQVKSLLKWQIQLQVSL